MHLFVGAQSLEGIRSPGARVWLVVVAWPWVLEIVLRSIELQEQQVLLINKPSLQLKNLEVSCHYSEMKYEKASKNEKEKGQRKEN